MFGLLNSTSAKISAAKILYKFTVLFFGKHKRVIERNGLKYEIDLAEGIELSLFLFGKYQKHITQNSFLRIHENDVIVDIGANVGLMTLQFAQLVPKGRVYSFEPTHYALDRLKKNLSLNPEVAKNVTVINAFVSVNSTSDPKMIAYSSWRVNGEKIDNEHPYHKGTAKDTQGVGSVSLDDYVEEQKMEKIDLIKVDTDGNEKEVFLGAAKAIAKYRPKIIFEITQYLLDEKKMGFDFYIDYFGKLNYKMMDTVTDTEVTIHNYMKYIPKDGGTDFIAIPL